LLFVNVCFIWLLIFSFFFQFYDDNNLYVSICGTIYIYLYILNDDDWFVVFFVCYTNFFLSVCEEKFCWLKKILLKLFSLTDYCSFHQISSTITFSFFSLQILLHNFKWKSILIRRMNRKKMRSEGWWVIIEKKSPISHPHDCVFASIYFLTHGCWISVCFLIPILTQTLHFHSYMYRMISLRSCAIHISSFTTISKQNNW
jgi:hypothetical protein